MIDVVIIDDDPLLRESLAILIRGTKGFSCTKTYNDCETALKNLENDLPDVILLDIGLPGMSGIEGVRAIKDILSEIEIIMLTIYEDHHSVFESLQNGASGYLIKNIEPVDLLKAIKEVYHGGSPMNMEIARMVVDSLHKNPPEEPITSRQQEVLEKLCEGKSYQAIANELFISKATVKFHIKNIYKILHVSNRTQAAIKAKEENII